MHAARKQLKLGWGGTHAFLPLRLAGLAPNPLLCFPTYQVMFPVFLGEPVSPEMLATTLAELDVTLQLLEDKFLQNKAFLIGPHVSLADLVAITELMHVSCMDRVGLLGGEGPGELLKSCHRLCLSMETSSGAMWPPNRADAAILDLANPPPSRSLSPYSLWVLAAKSLKVDPSWLHGAGVWRQQWERISSRRPMRSS